MPQLLDRYRMYHCYFNVLGRGVFSTADINGGAFLYQYYGELITGSEGEWRDTLIPSCFLFSSEMVNTASGMCFWFSTVSHNNVICLDSGIFQQAKITQFLKFR